MAAAELLSWKWLRTGDEAFAAMLTAIDGARASVRLEIYIYGNDPLGLRFRAALLRARQRGVSVQLLVDAIGSFALPGDFWAELTAAGATVRVFNPVALQRFGIRNHRKLLVCDDRVAFIGGFNLSQEYVGDGVTQGWCDLGLRLEGGIAASLGQSFDAMFGLAEFRHKRMVRLWRAQHKLVVATGHVRMLFGGPGRGLNPIRQALHKDLAHARDVRIVEAYFLPTWRIRRLLMRAARRGATVRLILAGKSDVELSRLAGRSLYRRVLNSGAHISEYTPQILHAKLMVIDQAVYVGSANLDPRSLSINYELMLRFQIPEMVMEAREIFAAMAQHGAPIELAAWKKSRSLWQRIKERCAHFVLARIDPHLARRQWRALPD